MNDKDRLLLEQWKMAAQFHLHMDNIAWRRASSFVAVNGILFGALGALSVAASSPYALLVKALLVATLILGSIVSWLWAVVQKRTQLYHAYRLAQARKAEEALTANGERVLTLHEKNLNEQEIDDRYLNKYRVYLRESSLGKQRTHELVFGFAVVLTAVWIVLALVVSWHVFSSVWVCIGVSLIPLLLWVWLVWDACLLPSKRSPDQAGS